MLRRGPRGYGFSLTAIRVFYGDSGYFTLHHMISVLRQTVNPLMGTLKPQSNGPLYSNTVVGTLVVDG